MYVCIYIYIYIYIYCSSAGNRSVIGICFTLTSVPTNTRAKYDRRRKGPYSAFEQHKDIYTCR